MAASFYAFVLNTTYEIYLGSGLNTRTLVASGTLEWPGYRTVDFPAPWYPTSDARFYLIAHVTMPGYDGPLAVESKQTDYSSQAVAHAGESYISLDGATGWTNISDPDVWGNPPTSASRASPAPPRSRPTRPRRRHRCPVCPAAGRGR